MIGFRVDSDVREILEKRAAAVGVSVSEYLRVVVESFTAVDAQKFGAMKERRTELIERLAVLANEVATLESALFILEARQDELTELISRARDELATLEEKIPPRNAGAKEL